MSCYGCVTKFSFFTKEQSCANCHFSFCSKCLKQKALVAEEEKNVCKNCYKKLTSKGDKMSTADMDTPDSLLKRLETLENPAKPPITIFRHSNRLTNLKCGLSSEDKKILERLEKLKADHKVSHLPDESEIKRRLALLQDKSEESLSGRPQKLDSAPKLPQEQVDDLLRQYADEASLHGDLEIRANRNLEAIENRLRKLQMSASSGMKVDLKDGEEEDEDTITGNLIKKAIAEAQLEKRLEESRGKGEDSDISDMDDNENDENENDELPWCIICNENAILKCYGCDGSLYCDTCFKQGHEFFNMEDHKSVPFTRKDSLTED